MSFFKNNQKGIMTIVFSLLYFVSYYLVNMYVSTKDSLYTLKTSLDSFIPFIPGFILPYLSLFVLVFVPYFIVKNKRVYNKIMLTYSLTAIFSFIVFVLFPVQMIRPEIHAQTIFENMMVLLYASELPFNAFPSLHVALSFLPAFFTWRFRRKLYPYIFMWSFLVTVSILFVKQHYVLDAVGGFLIAVIAYLIFDKVLTRNKCSTI